MFLTAEFKYLKTINNMNAYQLEKGGMNYSIFLQQNI